MAHQSTIERAHPVSFEPKNYEAHHNKPEEHPDTLPSELNELWLVVFGLLAFLIMIETMHINYHRQGKAWLEAPQCRTSD